MRSHSTWFVPVAAVLLGLGLGGCTQVWQNVSESLHLDSATTKTASADQEVTVDQIAALGELADFETAAGTPEDPAAEHMRELGNQVVALLTDHATSQDEKNRHFSEILAHDLDIPLIGRFAMGRYWKKASDAQRQAYLDAFKRFVVRTYSERLGGIAIDQFAVLRSEPLKGKDVLVHSEVVQGGDPKPVRAAWRVRNYDGTYRILDLTVEGISLAMLLRQEFASVLRNRGGVDGLISMLKERSI